MRRFLLCWLFAAAAISYQIIEQPFRVASWPASRVLPLLRYFLALLCGAAISRTVFHYNSA